MHRSDVRSRERESSNGSFAIGVLCGAAVGAAVALLLAPKTGEDLRGQLFETADRLRRRAADTYGDASSAVDDLMDRGRDAVRKGREKFDQASAAVDDAVGAGRDAVKRGREAFDDSRSEMADV